MKLSPKVRNEILRRYAAGEKPDAIAADHGIHPATVQKNAHRAGAWLGGYRQRQRQMIDAAVLAAHAAGWPEKPPQLAARLKLSRHTINQAARRVGLDLAAAREQRNADIRARRAAGEKLHVLAECYRLDKSTICQIAKREARTRLTTITGLHTVLCKSHLPEGPP